VEVSNGAGFKVTREAPPNSIRTSPAREHLIFFRDDTAVVSDSKVGENKYKFHLRMTVKRQGDP